MARLESKALAGYFPYPAHLLPATAALVAVEGNTLAVCDPCAGDGAALTGLLDAWRATYPPSPYPSIRAYTVELEATRAAACKLAHGQHWQSSIHGDAFRVQFDVHVEARGCDILWLNPPYDVLPGGDRLERLWLERWTGVLRPGAGVLLMAIPRTALAACADYLARHYIDVSVVRLPDPDYADYQQVVVVATRAPAPIPDSSPAIPIAILEPLPVLGTVPRALAYVRGHADLSRLDVWQLQPSDQGTLIRDGRPGVQTGATYASATLGLDRPVSAHIQPPTNAVLQPPRPGHIAQALAMGLFNGVPLAPDYAHLPTILLKGVFTRERVAVSERTNKDGDVVGVVEVEQPQLRLTALDMGRGTLHPIAAGVEPTGSHDLATMNAADLLACYGAALAAALAQACPPLHAPGHPESPLPPTARTPFVAQRPAISAALKSLIRLRENPPILGEVGVGKTTVALTIARSLAPDHAPAVAQWAEQPLPFRPVRTVLVVCPPHLLSTWQDEAAAVLPGARTVLIQSRGDLDALRAHGRAHMSAPHSGVTIAILSRETAKLGHGYAPVGAVCPDCGQPHGLKPSELVTKRARCRAARLVAQNALAHALRDLAILLAPTGHMPIPDLVPPTLRGRPGRDWAQIATRPALLRVLDHLRTHFADAPIEGAFVTALRALAQLVLSIPDPDVRQGQILATLPLYALRGERGVSGPHGDAREILRMLALCMDDDAGRRIAIGHLAPYRELESDRYSYGTNATTIAARTERTRALLNGENPGGAPYEATYPVRVSGERTVVRMGGYSHPETTVGSVESALDAMRDLLSGARFGRERTCGAALYQATPEPRRLALAPIIARHYRDVIDMLIVDEAHEYANEGSAQQQAAHRLADLRVPTLWMSGSISDGFASGLFANLWAFSRTFRGQWARDGVAAFTRRYGYRKTYREFDSDGGEIDWRDRQFGAVSDRQIGSGVARTLGESPGVLPHCILAHILPTAVMLQKRDLDVELPPLDEQQVPILVAPGHPLLDAEATLRTKIITQIGRDRFIPSLSGRLFGALGQVPFFMDRATVGCGNGHPTRWEARYPESVGGGLVAAVDLLPSDLRTPKESWLHAEVAAELAEGRNVMVGVLNTGKGMGLVARLAALLSDLAPVVVLDSDKVSAGKRKAWITEHVVAKGARILIVNPTAVQTGLNNLVHFNTLILYQTPPGHAKLYRQVIGRVHRPGQTKPVRVRVPFYVDSTQQIAIDHLARKVGASLQVDGLDIRSALESAGAGVADALDVLSLGEQIYRRLLDAQPAPSYRQEVLFAAD